MATAGREQAVQRPRRPVVAFAVTLVGAAAMVGYSAFVFNAALQAYLHCNPTPSGTICTYHPVWGFSPTFFLIAVIVGLAAGAALTVLAFMLWARPRDHTVIGALILAFSAVSVVAYGGAFVGLAAGLAGGILALVYKPPRFRELSQWSAPRFPGRPTLGREAHRGPSPSPSGIGAAITSPLPPLSADAYAPLPPAGHRSPSPPVARPAPGPTPYSSSTSPGAPAPPASPRFGSIASALATGRPGTVAAPSVRSAPSGPPPPHPAPPVTGTGVAPRTPAPAPGPRIAASLPPSGAGPPPAPAGPVVLPRGTSPEQVVQLPGPRNRSWKCDRCGLTNAPWSKSCTKCQNPAPPG